jgi:hypothetical protein
MLIAVEGWLMEGLVKLYSNSSTGEPARIMMIIKLPTN